MVLCRGCLQPTTQQLQNFDSCDDLEVKSTTMPCTCSTIHPSLWLTDERQGVQPDSNEITGQMHSMWHARRAYRDVLRTLRPSLLLAVVSASGGRPDLCELVVLLLVAACSARLPAE